MASGKEYLDFISTKSAVALMPNADMELPAPEKKKTDRNDNYY